MLPFKPIGLQVNVKPLREALLAQPELFGVIPYRGEKGSPHEEMKDIWVRYKDISENIKSGDFSNMTDEHDSVWYPSIKTIPVKSIIFKIMAAVKGERLGGVLITKLPPGGKIKPHHDEGWHASYYQKYYVPIQNGKGATFDFESGSINPDEGDVWWFDNSYTHWVENNSDKDRIAMIVCIKTEVV